MIILVTLSLLSMYANDEHQNDGIEAVVERNKMLSDIVDNASCSFRIITANARLLPEIVGEYSSTRDRTLLKWRTGENNCRMIVNGDTVAVDSYLPTGKVISTIVPNEGKGYGPYDIRTYAMLKFYDSKLRIIDYYQFHQSILKHSSGIKHSNGLAMITYDFGQAKACYTFDLQKKCILMKVEHQEANGTKAITHVEELAKIDADTYFPAKVTLVTITNGKTELVRTVHLSKWKKNDSTYQIAPWTPAPNAVVKDLINRVEHKYDENGKLVNKAPLNPSTSIATPAPPPGSSPINMKSRLETQYETTGWTRYLIPGSLIFLGITGLGAFYLRRKNA